MRTRIVNRAVISCLAAVAGSSGLGVAAASADTVLAPTNDTYVASAAPAANFASASLLGVTGTPASQALLRFTAPSGAIGAAKLRLYATASSSSAITVRGSSCAWTTTTVTWNTRPALGAAIASKSSVSAGWNDIALPATAVSSGAATCLQVTKPSGAGVQFHAVHNTHPSELVLTAAPAPPAPTPPPPPATVVGATPLWNGDTFTIDPTGFSHGGAGALPSYQWSSASGPAGGYFQPHSNTDPNVHGATRVPDPAGINRTVIKLNADERKSNGSYVRVEIRGKAQFGPGMDRWVTTEVFVPNDTPTITTSSKFWTIQSIFGAPYSGSSPDSFSMRRNGAGTGNDFTWCLPDGTPIWRTPATKGVWHIIARHIVFSTSASQGYSEVWHSERNAAGTPTTPMTRGTISGGGIAPTARRYYATLDPAHNWDGVTLNHPDIKNYHSANMWPGHTFTPLYFARFRVYDGAVPAAQIDPYYTGLK